VKDTNATHKTGEVDGFVSHLESASKTVEKWPEWKRCIITSSNPSHNDCGVELSKTAKGS
jgi:hypothetical protein